MPDPYADEPERRTSTGGAVSISKNVGPLPVWGWAIVAIGAVFLYRRISGGTANPAQQAASATGLSAPGYSPMNGGVYLLPGTSPAGTPATPAAPNGTGTTPAAPASYLTTIYPVSGSGKAPAGAQCPPGYVLIQGPNGYTCATSDQAVALGKYLQAVAK